MPNPLHLDSLAALRTLCMALEPLAGGEESLVRLMRQAVGQLEQLASLELSPGPASWQGLQRMTNLQGLYLRQAPAPLPPGSPWLRSLRWAVLPVACVSQSRSALAAATRLQQLCIDCGHAGLLDDAQAVLAWASSFRSLRRLDLYMGDRRSALIRAAAAAAHRRYPHLTVTLDGRLLHDLGLEVTFA